MGNPEEDIGTSKLCNPLFWKNNSLMVSMNKIINISSRVKPSDIKHQKLLSHIQSCLVGKNTIFRTIVLWGYEFIVKNWECALFLHFWLVKKSNKFLYYCPIDEQFVFNLYTIHFYSNVGDFYNTVEKFFLTVKWWCLNVVHSV